MSGTTVTLLRTGTCSITAHQSGNATHEPAPDVERRFAVTRVAHGHHPPWWRLWA